MKVRDSFFKEIFRDKELVRQFVVELLPKVSDVKFNREVKDIVVENTSFSDPALSDKESDVLVRLIFQDSEAFVYILIEHQSTVDYLMPFRILVYMTRIWEMYVKEKGKEAKKKGFKLPPIIPIVFYDGLRRWTAHRNFKEMVSMKDDYEVLIPSFEYLLLDVKELPEGVLEELNNALGFIMSIDVPSEEDVLSFIDKLRRIYEGLPKDQKELVDRYMRAIVALMGKVLGVEMEPDLFEEGGEKMFTILEHRIKSDLEKAKEEGRILGIEEGELKGKRAMLVSLIEKKFNIVDDELRGLVEDAPIDRVEKAALMIFDADSVEDIKKVLKDG